VKGRKGDHKGSDLNEIGIFTFLTLVIFFVALGFPTLINTSPTIGYEGIEWTPVTSAYQKAYAQQQDMETLAFYNYNPLIYSALLVMPQSTENLPDFTTFQTAYNNGIEIETGIIEFESGIPEIQTREPFSPPDNLSTSKKSYIKSENFDVPIPLVEQGKLFLKQLFEQEFEILPQAFAVIFGVNITDVVTAVDVSTDVNSIDENGTAVWQLREHDDSPSDEPRVGFRAFNGVLESNSADSDTVHIPARQGSGYIFKVFNKTDVIGKDFKVRWEGFNFGQPTSDNARMEVFDGAYIRSDNTHFPDNAGKLLIGGGLLASANVLNIGFALQNSTILANDIDYASSTEDQVTFFLRVLDLHTLASARIEVHLIQIGNDTAQGGNVTLYEFTNPIVGYVDTSVDTDNGIVEGTCTGECPPQAFLNPDAFDVWQYREHRDQTPSGITVNECMEFQVGDKNRLSIFQFNTAECRGVADGYLFKSFDKTEFPQLVNDSLRVRLVCSGCDSRLGGLGSPFEAWRPNLNVIDGAYDRGNFTTFPDNSTVVFDGAGLLGFEINPKFRTGVGTWEERELVASNAVDESTFVSTSSKSGIRYGLSTEDSITFAIRVLDTSSGTTGSAVGLVLIGSIEIDDVGFWNFTNPTILPDVNGTSNDRGLIQVSSFTRFDSTPQEPAKPSAPVVTGGLANATISWTAPTTESDGDPLTNPIIGYYIKRNGTEFPFLNIQPTIHLKFDGNETGLRNLGTTLTDNQGAVGGNPNTAYAQNYTTDGKIFGAFQFDGQTAMEYDNISAVQFGAISFWIKPANLDATQTIFEIHGKTHQVTDEAFFGLNLLSNGGLFVDFTPCDFSGTIYWTIASGAGVIDTTNYHHVVIQQAGDEPQLWVNGVLQAPAIEFFNGGINEWIQQMKIGDEGDPAECQDVEGGNWIPSIIFGGRNAFDVNAPLGDWDQFYNGTLDDLRVYVDPLSIEGIWALGNQTEITTTSFVDTERHLAVGGDFSYQISAVNVDGTGLFSDETTDQVTELNTGTISFGEWDFNQYISAKTVVMNDVLETTGVRDPREQLSNNARVFWSLVRDNNTGQIAQSLFVNDPDLHFSERTGVEFNVTTTGLQFDPFNDALIQVKLRGFNNETSLLREPCDINIFNSGERLADIDSGGNNLARNINDLITLGVELFDNTSSPEISVCSAFNTTVTWTLGNSSRQIYAIETQLQRHPDFIQFGLDLVSYVESTTVQVMRWFNPEIELTFATAQEIPLDETAIDVWQWREHRDDVDGSPAVPAECTTVKIVNAFGTNLTSLGADSAECGSGIADGYIFKTFDKTEFPNIENQTIRFRGQCVDCEDTVLGEVTITRFEVTDGAYNRTSFTDFPDNSTRVVKGGGLLGFMDKPEFRFGSVTWNTLREVALSTCYDDEIDNICHSDANLKHTNFALSTENEVTVFVHKFESQLGSGNSQFRLQSIEIPNIGLWNFTNPIITAEVNNTNNDFGLIQVSEFVADTTIHLQPERPTGLSAVGGLANTTLTWSAPTTNENGDALTSPIIGYYVQRNGTEFPFLSNNPLIHFKFDGNETGLRNYATFLRPDGLTTTIQSQGEAGLIGNPMTRYEQNYTDAGVIFGAINLDGETAIEWDQISEQQLGSIMMWINPDDLSSTQRIFQVSTTPVSSENRQTMYLELSTAGTLTARFFPCGSSPTNGEFWRATTSSGVIVADQWQHITLQQNGFEPQIFVNGTLVTTTIVTPFTGGENEWFQQMQIQDDGSFSPTKCVAVTDNNFRPNSFIIGARYDTSVNAPLGDLNEFFRGQVDDARFYVYPLSDNQITQIVSQTEITSTAFNDTTKELQGGGNFTYRVQAVNDLGNSLFTDQQTASVTSFGTVTIPFGQWTFSDYARSKSDTFTTSDSPHAVRDIEEPNQSVTTFWITKQLGVPQGQITRFSAVAPVDERFSSRFGIEFNVDNTPIAFDPDNNLIKEVKLRGKNNATSAKRACDVVSVEMPISFADAVTKARLSGGIQDRNLVDQLTVVSGSLLLYDETVSPESAPCVADTFGAFTTITLNNDLKNVQKMFELQLGQNQTRGANGAGAIQFGLPQDSFGTSSSSPLISRWLEPEIEITFFNATAQVIPLVATAENVWQLKESRDGTVGAEHGFKVSPNNTLQMGTDEGGVDGNDDQGIGHTFKVFNKTDIIGKDFKVGWESASDGVSAVRIHQEVVDGSYNRTSSTDFPNNAGRLVKGGGVLFISTSTIAPFSLTNSTVSGGDIDYASSQLDQVTIFLTMIDVSDFFGANYSIAFVQLGNDTAQGGNATYYNFTSPIVEFTATEPNSQEFGLAEASECIGECPPQPFTVPLVPAPPAPVLFNTTAVVEDVFLEWRETGLDAYWKFTQTTGNLLAEDFARIDDADSTSITAMDQSNTGIIGNGYRATGASVRIAIGGDANDWNFIGQGNSTFNAWMRSDTLLGVGTIFVATTDGGASEEGVEISMNLNTGILSSGLTILDDDVSVFGGGSGTGFLIKNDATYHMYTWVVKEGERVEFYRDGVEFSNVTNTNTFNINATNNPPIFFSEGSESVVDTNYDEFSWWSKALTPTQITELYNTGSALALTSSTFEETTATDFSVLRSNATFADNFDTDKGWLSNNTEKSFVNTTASHLRRTLPDSGNNQNDDITFDLRPFLGGNDFISTELWSLRFSTTFDNIDEFLAGGGTERHIIGITEFDSNTNSIVQGAGTPCGATPPADSSCAGDGLGFQINGDILQLNGKTSTLLHGWNACGTGTNLIDTGVTFGSQFWNTTDTYYWQIVRSATPNPSLNTLKVFSDADFTDELFGISSIQGNCFGQDQLRFLRFGGGFTTTNTDDQLWNIDNIEFYDGQNVTGSTQFEVIIPSIVAKHGAIQTNTTDATVTRGSFFEYKINATGSLQSTSNTLNVTTNDVGSTPVVNATAISSSQINVTFSVTFEGEGVPTTGVDPKNFTIFKENTTDATGFVLLTTVASTVSEIEDFAVDAGKNYTYNVAFLNVIGSSANGTDIAETPALVTLNASAIDVWQFREHQDSEPNAKTTSGIGGGKEECTEIKGSVEGLSITSLHGTTTGLCKSIADGYIFKTFDKTTFPQIINETIRVRVSCASCVDVSASYVAELQVNVFDGAFNRTSLVDFPVNATRIVKGGGLLGFVNEPQTGQGTITWREREITLANCLTDSPFLTCRSGNTVFTDSTEGNVTVAIQYQKTNKDSIGGGLIKISAIEIPHIGFWNFSSPVIELELNGTSRDFGLVQTNFTLQSSERDQPAKPSAPIITTGLTFEDDFSTDKGWLFDDPTKQFINLTSGKFQWENGGAGSEAHDWGASFDLTPFLSGSEINQTAYTLRFKAEFPTIPSDASPIDLNRYIGFREFNMSAVDTHSGGTCVGIECAENGDALKLTTGQVLFTDRTTDNNGFGWQTQTGSVGTLSNKLNNTEVFFELINDRNDVLGDGAPFKRVRMYNSSSFSEDSVVIDVTTTLGGELLEDMTHIFFAPFTTTTTPTFTVILIDDLQFFDGQVIQGQATLNQNVTLTWTEPTTEEDGDSLTNPIVGYYVKRNGTDFPFLDIEPRAHLKFDGNQTGTRSEGTFFYGEQAELMGVRLTGYAQNYTENGKIFGALVLDGQTAISWKEYGGQFVGAVSIWVKPDNLDSRQRIMSIQGKMHTFSDRQIFYADLLSNGRLQVILSQHNPVTWSLFTNTTTSDNIAWLDGNYHHIVVQQTGANPEIWVDGILQQLDIVSPTTVIGINEWLESFRHHEDGRTDANQCADVPSDSNCAFWQPTSLMIGARYCTNTGTDCVADSYDLFYSGNVDDYRTFVDVLSPEAIWALGNQTEITTTSFTDDTRALLTGGTFEYQIQAVNKDGNSLLSDSTVVNVTSAGTDTIAFGTLPFDDYLRAKSNDRTATGRTFFRDIEECAPQASCTITWDGKQLGSQISDPKGVEEDANVPPQTLDFTARIAIEFNSTDSIFDPFNDKIKEIKLRGKNNATDGKRPCDVRAWANPLSFVQAFNGTFLLNDITPKEFAPTRVLNDIITIGTLLYDESVEPETSPCVADTFGSFVEITLNDNAVYAVERQLQRNTVSGNNVISFGLPQEVFSATFGGRVMRWLEPEIQIEFFTTQAVALIANQTETDTATVLDQVQLTTIFETNQTDTATVNDQTQFNTTKSLLDIATILDDPRLNITKPFLDSATVLDQVQTDLVALKELNDTATVLDQTQFNITKVIRNVEIGSANVTIFSDDFSVDPASNGWSETSSQFSVQGFPATATGTISPATVQGTEARFEKTGLVSGIKLNIDRTIDTTGFSNIAFNVSAFQDSSGAFDALFGDSEPHNALRVEADFGSGFVLVFTDMQVWNGVEDTAGESAGSSIGGQLTNTATGLIPLSALADNNPNFKIRISWTTATAPNDFLLDNFELVGVGGGSGRFTGDLITVLDQTQFDITKPLQDTATILDQVNTALIALKELNDTATVNDDEILTITKLISDIATIVDDETLNITKSQSDLTNVNDTVVITPPTIPDGITTLVGSTSLNTCQLSWSAPFNGNSILNGYRILRQIDGTGFSIFVSNTTNTLTTFVDGGLVNNVLYEYDIRAGNRFGFAIVSSNIVDCMPIVGNVPTAPTVLDANEVANGDVTLTWLEPSFGDPTGYRIERKIGGGGFTILVNDTGTPDLIFVDSTTTPATQFTYRVAGFNSFGLGAFSNEASVTTASPALAPILSGVQNVNQIDLTWTVPASDNPINGYRIDKRINLGSFFTLIANTTTTLTTFSDLNVTKPDTFGYRVRALSSAGEGTVSNVVDIIFGSHVIVEVREQDGSGFKGGGTVKGENSTFNTLVGLDVNSNAIFDNLDVGNFNYTFTDADSFILNKTFNFPTPSGNLTSTFTINALVFDVSCPSGVGGTDIRIKVNYTDAKDITEFPATPVCDSSDKISWTTRWQGEAVNDTSTMIADFISPKFQTNADTFLVSTLVTATSFNVPLNQIESVEYVVNATDVTISFDLFLGEAPPAGGGGTPTSPAPSTPAPIPDPEIVFADVLTGLSLISRTHQFAQAGDIIEGFITVNWEGEQNLIVKQITVGQTTLDVRFDPTSFPLDQTIEGIGEFAMSSANVPYIIVLPAVECNPEMGLTQNCFDPILHTIVVEFRFGLGIQEYQASTEIFVDGRPIPLDIVQLQIIILFIVLIASAVFGNFIRMRLKKAPKRQARQKKKFKKKFDSS